MSSDLVVVGLKGGSAERADLALAVDTDPGNVGPVEWYALVSRGDMDALVNVTGADVVREAREWDGEPFGDGAGYVERAENGSIVGCGCYTASWIAGHLAR